MTDLEKAKIAFSDACINLEIAQTKYNESKAKLIQKLNKSIPTTEEVPK